MHMSKALRALILLELGNAIEYCEITCRRHTVMSISLKPGTFTVDLVRALSFTLPHPTHFLNTIFFSEERFTKRSW